VRGTTINLGGPSPKRVRRLSGTLGKSSAHPCSRRSRWLPSILGSGEHLSTDERRRYGNTTPPMGCGLNATSQRKPARRRSPHGAWPGRGGAELLWCRPRISGNAGLGT
jgi:hypothetical protein